MKRTSTPPARRATRGHGPRRSSAGGTLIGIFIGIIIGIGLAAGVAYWLMKNNPALQVGTTPRDTRDASTKDTARPGKTDAAPDKPRFDFYKILPGGEEPKTQAERKAPDRPDRVVAEQAKEKTERPADKSAQARDKAAPPELVASAGKADERFWLQAGSFASAAEAENLKARLAFAGWEAAIQEASLPDKSVRYRVRLGPYDNTDELNRMKNELGKRGFEVAVIKN